MVAKNVSWISSLQWQNEMISEEKSVFVEEHTFIYRFPPPHFRTQFLFLCNIYWLKYSMAKFFLNTTINIYI